MNDATIAATFELNTDPARDPAWKLGRTYAEPRCVLNDPGLSIEEKRSILAAWASDAFAVENAPALRRMPGSERDVTIDELLEALSTLDHKVEGLVVSTSRRQVRRAAIEAFRASRADARRLQGRFAPAFAG